MKRFIALFAILIVAMIGAATASAGEPGPGKAPTAEFCFGGTNTVTAKGKTAIAIDTYLASVGGIYVFDFKTWQWVLVTTVTSGPCYTPAPPAETPQIDREGSCTVVGNVFENVDANQLQAGSYLATDGSTVAIVPADFVEGVGLTCNVPSGDVYAGYDVADNFGGVEGFVDTAAPQFNFYPYYVVKA